MRIHRVRLLVGVVLSVAVVLTVRSLASTTTVYVDVSALTGDAKAQDAQLEQPSEDQHDKESKLIQYLNSDGDERIDAIKGLTDVEIREQLEQIKHKQSERERESNNEISSLSESKIVDANLDGLARVDTPPDNEPWVPYELERKVIYKERELDPHFAERVNGTLFTLCRNQELFEILDSIQQLETRFNSRYHYDWVFLNDEPFTEEFINLTSNMVSGRARYGLIPKEHWSYPEFIDQSKAKSIRESKKWSMITYGSSESYRHMCRYNSLFFYKHPIMESYEYFWRVEPHVSFGCDILEDPMKVLKDEGKVYGFTISMQELPNTIETLWDTTMQYFNKPEVANELPEDNLMEFISDDKGESYNLCHYWSNFEVVDLSFYRSKLYEEYVEYLDKAGGFFYERWGDAPIHSIAASLLLNKTQVHLFQNISYSHTVASTCPLNDLFHKLARCTCDPHQDWSIRSESSCNVKFLDVSGQEKNKDFEKYRLAIYDRMVQEQQLRDQQRQLRMETARRQAENRKVRAQERHKERKKIMSERKVQRQKAAQKAAQ
ncbi:hypothetical protein DAMA08_000200 [Martiniozyma asiatica (nom. inval.)]|nr:hypothetical protein DAMA08_000200 [Martiniozyma asiatica]